jgi:xanthine dehydrogenase accessory factor
MAEMDDQTGAICGGSALFMIDANPSVHLNVYLKLLESIQNHKSGALLTVLSNLGTQSHEIQRFWIERNSRPPEAIRKLLHNEQIDLQEIISSRIPFYLETAKTIETSQAMQTFLFIEPIHPVPQLVIAGAGHIGQALCRISDLVDFEIIVVDDRPELAVPSRFPEASRVICMPLQEAFESLTITPETYIVIATHGHRTDMEALRSCICSNAAYIGVIGSKRKIALMEQKFIAEKWAVQDEWNFVHTPVGLAIHSRTVNEIAVSILAELIRERYENHFVRSKKIVDSIVLAAGKSTRMGEQKLLMPYKGKTMIATVAGKISGTNSHQTFVVTGNNSLEMKEALRDYEVTLVKNDNFEEGMLSSVQTGVGATKPETDGMLILLGDQPMVSETVINRLISVFQKTEKGLLIPVFRGKRGHPVLISAKYKNELKSLHPEIGLRELFLNHPEDVLEIEAETGDVLKDIDTQEDYVRETEGQ